MLIITLVQGFDVPLWRKILGMKLTGTTLLYFLQPLKLKLKKKKKKSFFLDAMAYWSLLLGRWKA